MAKRYDTIVVGAGAAGLAAARHLAGAGLDVCVLEAGTRVGGRIFTAFPAGRDLPVELGAEFLHGEAEATRALLDELGLRHVEGEGENVVARGGRVTRDDAQFQRMARVFAAIGSDGADESFAAFLARSPGGRRLAEARAQARRFVEGFHAAPAERISARALAAQAEDVPEVRRAGRVLAGHQAMVQLLAAELGDAVRLQAPVRRVEWQRGACSVVAERGARRERFQARSVIITVPIGVLQSGALAVLPMPRAAAFALDHLASGDVVRIPFLFRDRFWEEDERTGPRTAFIQTPASAFNVWWTQYPVRVPLLVAWSGGSAARALLRTSAEERAELALRDLAAALGRRPRDLSGRVLHWQSHDWSADPLALGSYSYPLVGGAAAAKRLAQVHAGTLAFAGEAASEENGTVAGAIGSGVRAARSLQRALA